jgi:hypothetical protein
VAGRIRSIEKSNDLTWNQSPDLPACSIAPQPAMLSHAPSNDISVYNNGMTSSIYVLYLFILKYTVSISDVIASNGRTNELLRMMKNVILA